MQVLEENQKFERYRIVRLLGKSITGESYEAEDPLLQRTVVLKLIHPWSPLPGTARRQFFRFMQSISEVTHPALAAISDYGEAHGYLYNVRSFSTAGSLLGDAGRDWYRPPLALPDAITYLRPIAQGLHALHKHGYAHGAITMANILVLHAPSDDTRTGKTLFWLADTGNADFVRCFGQPIMKVLPVTLAPEQATGQAIPVSDQYALAVLLYFWLSGRFPFLGNEEEILRKKQAESFTPLTSIYPTITLRQEGIIRRALRSYPNDRYPSILAFIEALQSTLPRIQNNDQVLLRSEQKPAPQPASPVPMEPDVPQPVPEPTPAPPGPPARPEPEPEQPEPSPSPVPPAPTPEIIPEPVPPAPDVPQPLPTPSQDPPPVGESRHGPSNPYLVITSPFHTEPAIVILKAEDMTVGRAGSSAILLESDPQTSRHHALLQFADNRYSIVDQRSSQGVFVNDEKLSDEVQRTLVNGDRITIGQHLMVFHDSVEAQPLQELPKDMSYQC